MRQCYRHAMKHRLVLLLLAAHAGAALAQYKCTAASGAVTFQQTPCVGALSEEKLVVIPNGHPPAASGVRPPAVVAPAAKAAPAGKAGTSVDQRMLADYQRQQERNALQQTLRTAQDDAAKRAAQRTADVAAAQNQYAGDLSNTQALNDALAAIDSRYRALSVVDNDRIQTAQDALDQWDRADEARARTAASATSR
jgi:hypothetical protein